MDNLQRQSRPNQIVCDRPMEHHTILIIGAGQSGLSVAYYLRRLGMAENVVLLDEQTSPGGAWNHAWESLRLFSPRESSSLPGMMFPMTSDIYPSRDQTISYLATYERRYGFIVRRPVHVHAVRRQAASGFVVSTSIGEMTADVVVGATGTWSNPVMPTIPGLETFSGTAIHSAFYKGPEAYRDKRILVVGAGNSGAQIFADLAPVARVTWVTREQPQYLPDHVDGRVLFDEATLRKLSAEQSGAVQATPTIGEIVMVESVRALRESGRLTSVGMFSAVDGDSVIWANGYKEHVDVIIFCTGFRAALECFSECLPRDSDGRIVMDGTAVVEQPGLYLVGYGSWTGFASATLIGVGRTAKSTAERIQLYLSSL